VEDNGKGFNLAAQLNGQPDIGGSEDGLRNMRQRLESVGGSCGAESVPSKGTTIWFILPLNRIKSGKDRT